LPPQGFVRNVVELDSVVAVWGPDMILCLVISENVFFAMGIINVDCAKDVAKSNPNFKKESCTTESFTLVNG
jgi:hypothetical protein